MSLSSYLPSTSSAGASSSSSSSSGSKISHLDVVIAGKKTQIHVIHTHFSFLEFEELGRSLEQGLSQDLTTGCPKLVIVGLPIFQRRPQDTQITTINTHSLIKIMHVTYTMSFELY